MCLFLWSTSTARVPLPGIRSEFGRIHRLLVSFAAALIASTKSPRLNEGVPQESTARSLCHRNSCAFPASADELGRLSGHVLKTGEPLLRCGRPGGNPLRAALAAARPAGLGVTATVSYRGQFLTALPGIAALPVVTMPRPRPALATRSPDRPVRRAVPRRLDQRSSPRRDTEYGTGRHKPTLVIPVAPATGLTRQAVDQAPT
jgi:hypothetical protein